MAFSSNGGRGGPLSEINVTPLVDVMLVLLIIFMVTAPMLTTGIDVDLPNAEAEHLPVDEDKPLIVIQPTSPERTTAAKTSRIYFFDDEIQLDRLAQRLQADARVQKHQEVFVHADERVPYGDVVRVLAVVRQAGIDKLGLVTDPLARE